MSVKSYFESERRKKQITWTLIILGALFAGAMLSSYYSDEKKAGCSPSDHKHHSNLDGSV